MDVTIDRKRWSHVSKDGKIDFNNNALTVTCNGETRHCCLGFLSMKVFKKKPEDMLYVILPSDLDDIDLKNPEMQRMLENLRSEMNISELLEELGFPKEIVEKQKKFDIKNRSNEEDVEAFFASINDRNEDKNLYCSALNKFIASMPDQRQEKIIKLGFKKLLGVDVTFTGKRN